MRWKASESMPMGFLNKRVWILNILWTLQCPFSLCAGARTLGASHPIERQSLLKFAHSQMNMSTRNLQRRLHQEGASFKMLLEKTRKDLSHQYIKNSNLSINEITFMLGFSEPANFTRAFKRWTDHSPSEYRLTH
jgi:AraC-like DNA-binding protein